LLAPKESNIDKHLTSRQHLGLIQKKTNVLHLVVDDDIEKCTAHQSKEEEVLNRFSAFEGLIRINRFKESQKRQFISSR
jgi:hypothetical protein